MHKKKLSQFNPIIILFLIISSTILLIYSLGNENAIAFIQYFTYLYSTFSLIVTLWNIKRFYLYLKKKILNTKIFQNSKKTLYKNKHIQKYFEDIRFKNFIHLYFSAIINFTFIFIKFINGIANKSIWFISLSVYYFLLTTIKIILLGNLKKRRSF